MHSLILFPTGNNIKALIFEKAFQYMRQVLSFEYNGAVSDGVAKLLDQTITQSFDDVVFIAPFNETFVKTLTVNKVERKYLKQIIINE